MTPGSRGARLSATCETLYIGILTEHAINTVGIDRLQYIGLSLVQSMLCGHVKRLLVCSPAS